MSDVARRTCRDGSWLAVFGTDLTVVLPGRDRARAARLWELMDAGGGFEQVLDALVSPTVSGSGEFVLARAQGRSARLLVRGTPAVSVHTAQGPTEVTGGDLVWAEAAFSDVEVMVLSLPDSTGLGEELPVVPGLVRVSTVVWGEEPAGSGSAAEPARRGGAHAATTTHPATRTGTNTDGPTGRAPATGSDFWVGGGSGTPPGSETGDLPAALPPAVPPAAPAPVPPVPPETQAIVSQGVDPEDETDLIPFEEPAADRDGLTRFGAPPVSSGPSVPPGIPGQPPAPAVLAQPVARLVFSHGETVAVDRSVVIGRSPEVRRRAAGEEPRLVAVPSPGQEISSTHLEIRPGSGVDHGAATATDLGSTNGTLVMQPGLPPEELQPGIAVALMPGAVLDLGDGLTIQVTRP